MVNKLSKYVVFVLSLMLSLSLCACGKEKEENRTESKSTGFVEIAGTESLNESIDTEENSQEGEVDITESNINITTQELNGENGQYAPNIVTEEITTEYPLANGPSQVVSLGEAVSPGHGDVGDNAPIKEVDVNVDYDFTAINAKAMYTQVYNMLKNPDEFLNKIIKISGGYYPFIHEDTGEDYHYIMVKDASLCCAIGLEFVWDNGVHSYPEEYPLENQVIQLTGVYSQYEEDGYTYYYLDVEGYEVVE